MPISIYPPTLKSTQSAFLYTTTSYTVNFTLQSITSASDIGHIQISVVKQSNNRTIVNTNVYPDGIIYKAKPTISSTGSGSVTISTILSGGTINLSSSDLSEQWVPGSLYKIQIRFGTAAKYSSNANFATWKQEQIENNAFSEWSTVMVIKAIEAPTVSVTGSSSSTGTETTQIPKFFGSFGINASSKEGLEQYKFDLLNSSGTVIETTGWLQHNGSVNTVNSHRFLTSLTPSTYYTVRYSIVTVNGYTDLASYRFLVSIGSASAITNVVMTGDDSSIYCRENGCIGIKITTSGSGYSGTYVLLRSSENSNYQHWEALQYITLTSKALKNETVAYDFTIESGKGYKYAIYKKTGTTRSSLLYDSNNRVLYVYFEYSYLYRDGIQLRLSLNQKMNSFKHTVLRTKQDTLGSRYPYLLQNGVAYYAEFPINGLITFQMDEDQTFFTKGSAGYMYNGETVLSYDRFEQQVNNSKRPHNVLQPFVESEPYRLSKDVKEQREGKLIIKIAHPEVENLPDLPLITSDLTHSNIYIERIFREKVEEFLNDFNCKLYKSPTEGNILISLMNVSLSPNEALGRMIFEFSATAYEVAENTIENLDSCGIITAPAEED